MNIPVEKWKLIYSLARNGCHKQIYEAVISGLVVWKIVRTPYRSYGYFGNSTIVYCLEDGRKFMSEEELLAELIT